jgi:ribonuclease VapC
MIVDSSALVAMALREAGHDLLIDKLSAATQAGIGAPTLVETAIVLSARLRRDARGAWRA